MSSNALDSITIQGFKSIASVERLELRPINVVIGPNGSGKSNFIGVFAFLHAIVDARLRDYVTAVGGAEKVLYFGSKITKEMQLRLSFQGGTNGYELKLAPTADDGLFPSSETAFVGIEPRLDPLPLRLHPSQQGREAGISDPSGQMWNWVRHHLEGWRIYHLHDTSASSPMRKIAYVNDNRFLRADGSNLASFLYFLREKHIGSYGL